MGIFGTRKDGRHYPKHAGGMSKSSYDKLTAQDKLRKKTIHALNYDGGDYVGPNPSTRSRQLDRKKHNKNQPWENR